MVKNSHLKPKFIKTAKERLLADKKQLTEDINLLVSEDPILNSERTSERVPEFEDDSMQMQGHERIDEEKKVLKNHLEETEIALKKIEEGTYGICEKTGKPIDPARLKANPQARYTLDYERSLPQE